MVQSSALAAMRYLLDKYPDRYSMYYRRGLRRYDFYETTSRGIVFIGKVCLSNPPLKTLQWLDKPTEEPK